jgi:hypothetical protein
MSGVIPLLLLSIGLYSNVHDTMVQHTGKSTLYKIPQSVPVLCQMNQFPIYSYIFPSTLNSCKRALSFRLPQPTPLWISLLHHTCHMSRPSHSSFGRLSNIHHRSLLCHFLQSLVNPFFGSQIFSSAMCYVNALLSLFSVN